MRVKFILMIVGLWIFLFASLAAFLGDSNTGKAVVLAAVLSIIVVLLIYFQLKFYRDGDEKIAGASRKLPSADRPAVPKFLKSPGHRAIWQNMDHARSLMQRKEKEFLQDQIIEEKQTLKLPLEENILFMADRSRLHFWPLALASVALLFTAAALPKALSASHSFTVLILGLLGLLLSTAFKFPTRYYLTNFRILVRKTSPMGKAQWASMDYPRISSVSRKRNFAWEELTLRSGKEAIKIWGLPKAKLESMLVILRETVTNIT